MSIQHKFKSLLNTISPTYINTARLQPPLQSFGFFRDWAILVCEPSLCQLSIDSVRRPSKEHVHCQYGTKTSKLSAITPEAEAGIIKSKDIIICHSEQNYRVI